MTLADIIQIIIGALSLVATIAVSFFIYWLQTRHEREIEKIEAKRVQKELEEKAHVFLSENNAERDYLPLCVMASNLNRHDAHTRQIYTNFCRCPVELQNEILRQAEFDMTVPSDTEWVDSRMNCLIGDIEKHKLGRNYLYDGAKYLHRGYEYYREETWEELRYRKDFHRIATEITFYPKGDQSLLDYIDEYFRFLYSENKPLLYNPNPNPPLDYMWNAFNLGSVEEKEVCRWIIEAVSDVLIICHNRKNGRGKIHGISTDAAIETFEDKYYDTLLWLYYTYEHDGKGIAEENTKRKGKKKKNSKKNI